MKRAERESILRQGATRPETPRDRRLQEVLVQDLEGSPVKGRPLPLRLRNFRPTPDAYLASIGGPLPYMLRLLEIENRLRLIEERLRSAWQATAAECEGDAALFEARWRAEAAAWNLDEINDLIDRHNRFYPAESRLPMDPKTRDFVLVNGEDYRKRRLDAAWLLERFPPEITIAGG